MEENATRAACLPAALARRWMFLGVGLVYDQWRVFSPWSYFFNASSGKANLDSNLINDASRTYGHNLSKSNRKKKDFFSTSLVFGLPMSRNALTIKNGLKLKTISTGQTTLANWSARYDF
jgi:hypothetical protein